MSKIIIAEDNLEVQNFICHALENQMTQFELVDNNADFLSVLRNNPYSVVIADFFLRDDKNIFENALKELENPEKYKFIFITGYSDQTSFKSCLKFNPISFLSKPFTYQSIIFAVEKANQENFEDATFLEDFSKYLFENNLSSSELSAQVGEYLKNVREKYNITQLEFSNMVGISLRQIQRIEGGDNTSIDKLTCILRGVQKIKSQEL